MNIQHDNIDQTEKFIEVILPLPISQFFTYKVTLEQAEKLSSGCRVLVQFGARKLYTGLVYQIIDAIDSDYQIKPILEVIDTTPLVNQYQLKLWEWIAKYYMCSIGEVYKASLPSGLKLDSEAKLMVNEDFGGAELSNKETLIYDIIDTNGSLTINEISRSTKLTNIHSTVRKLVDKHAVLIEEQLRESYKPKTEKYLKLHPNIDHEFKLNAVLDELARAKKQFEIITCYIELSGFSVQPAVKAVKESELLEKSQAGSSSLKALLNKNILVRELKTISRLQNPGSKKTALNPLTTLQQQAIDRTREQFQDFDTVLLHGVTSSGKTEVYFHLIQETIEQGKQVLYLLPEIALTTQIINRLRNAFGDKVGIYHSKFSDNERVETYQSLLTDPGKYPIILGVRSSVFLPFTKLGLIVVDEEHENTYKQYDPAPRYNARDISIVLAKFHRAKILLGTATPSLETYHNVKNKKYGLVEMFQRYQNIKLPEIKTIDLNLAYRKKQMRSHFSGYLIDKIQEALDRDEQIILFQNRRGFSPYIQCNICGWIPYCKSCDVSLTYHKNFNYLSCHYCGHSNKMPRKCEKCGSTDLTTKGFGTEKIEEDLNLFFPGIKTARLDLDTAKTRRKYEQIIADFEQGITKILIGTQMVTKGLDFDNVSVVGILNADNMLSIPDFRAWERGYQLMSQVSGRAGRKNKQGLVIIQTRDVQNPIIEHVVQNNFKAMFLEQANERQLFKYPPFYRLIKINIKHKQKDVLAKAAEQFTTNLKKKLGSRVLGPEYPIVARIQTYYIKQVLVKLEKEVSVQKLKDFLADEMKKMNSLPEFKSVNFIADVDPM